MFKKFRDKLKNWTKKLSEKTEEVEETMEEQPKPEVPIPEDEPFEKVPKPEQKKEPTQEITKEETKEPIETDKEEPKKEIPLPTKFEPGLQSYQPDIEKIQEQVQELQEKSKEPEEFSETLKPGTEGFFKKIKSKISKVKITEKEFEVYERDLEDLLLENNVALEVTEKIIRELKERIVNQEFLKKELESQVMEDFKQIIGKILVDGFLIVDKVKEKSEKPYVILFCGINGTGKTTTIAKIAQQLKRNNVSSVIAAADTFRAASIEQIKKHGEKIGIKVISQNYGSDPAAVGFDAIKYAKKNRIDCVLIDTAGRMHTSKNLLKEIEKINRVCKPDLKVFVGESITGNDAIEQAKTFDWEIGIDGIILTKADIDEKGGTSLSVGYVLKKPILYLGTGQEYDKIEPFSKKKFIKTLGLDEGDEEV
ncbi:MAG: signal recognition particle-docking protein FtsY [Candidatus Nanoarchaeia archaeon]